MSSSTVPPLSQRSRHHREHHPLHALEHGCSAKPARPEIKVLDVLVHLNGVLSVLLVLSSYDLPDGPDLITEADPAALPEGWDAIPHGQARNLLLNPLHPAMAQVALANSDRALPCIAAAVILLWCSAEQLPGWCCVSDGRPGPELLPMVRREAMLQA